MKLYTCSLDPVFDSLKLLQKWRCSIIEVPIRNCEEREVCYIFSFAADTVEPQPPSPLPILGLSQGYACPAWSGRPEPAPGRKLLPRGRAETLPSPSREVRLPMKYLNLMVCGLSLLASATAARAEDISVDQMVCALDPQCSTPFGDRKMRGISATGPVTGPASAAVRPPGSFDITLNFPLNSAELTAESRSRLDRVAKALTEPSTSKMDIIVSGHTDARGSADYNLLLSERRAQAVRQFLITERGIDPKRS